MPSGEKISFNEQCRRGLEKRKQCVLKTCQHFPTIAFNHCWDCERYLESTPETQDDPNVEVRVVRPHNFTPEEHRAEVVERIGVVEPLPVDHGIKIRVQEALALMEQKRKAKYPGGDDRATHQSKKEARIDRGEEEAGESPEGEESPPPPALEPPPPPKPVGEGKPKKYISSNELFWMDPEEIKQMEDEYEVYVS